MRRVPFFRARTVVAILALALVATACGGGGGSDDPEAQLRDALRGMSSDDGLTLTLSIVSDPASLQALAAEDGTDLSEDDARKLLGLTLTVSVPDDEDEGVFALALAFEGDAVLELRAAGDDLYLRVDAETVLELVDEDPSTIDQVEAMLAGMGGLVPDGALRGEWIAIRDVRGLVEDFMGQDLPDEEDEEVTRARLERLAGILVDEATIASEGSDSAGDRISVRANLRAVFSALLPELMGLGLPTAELPSAQDVPDADVDLHLWVRGGRVTQVEFDFLQLAELDEDFSVPDGVEQLAIRAELEPYDGRAEIPDDAQNLDVEAIMGMFFGAMGGMFESGMDGMFEDEMPMEMFDDEDARAAYCASLEDMPQEMIDEHFADECPELASP